MTSDHELLDRLRAGDTDAFAELVERYHSRLVRVAQTVVGRRDVAEEVTQETWIAVVRGVDRFEERSTLRTWMFRICVNRARSAIGREERARPMDLTGPAVDPRRFTADGRWSAPPEDWTVAIDDRLVAAELLPRVMTAIDGLPDGQREVVTLRDVEGLSSKEVCAVLSIGAANERVLLHRARSRIRALLAAEMGGR